MTDEREQLHQDIEAALRDCDLNEAPKPWHNEDAYWEALAKRVVDSVVDRVVAERDRLRTELESFVEASLEECDYTSDGESGGWEPDDYERAKANIAEMHRVLLVRLERLFQTQDRAAAERESRFRWAEEAARVEAVGRWLHAEAVWQRQADQLALSGEIDWLSAELEKATMALTDVMADRGRYRLAWQSARRRARHIAGIRQARDAERRARFAVIDTLESAQRQMQRLEVQRDEWKAVFGIESGDIDTTPREKAAELAELRAKNEQWAATFGASALRDATALRARVADLEGQLARAFVPTPGWQALLRASLGEAADWMIETIESWWRMGTRAAEPLPAGVNELGQPCANPNCQAATPSDLQVPPSLGAMTTCPDRGGDLAERVDAQHAVPLAWRGVEPSDCSVPAKHITNPPAGTGLCHICARTPLAGLSADEWRRFHEAAASARTRRCAGAALSRPCVYPQCTCGPLRGKETSDVQ